MNKSQRTSPEKTAILTESILVCFCALLLAIVYHWTGVSSFFQVLESNPGDNLLNAFLLEHSYLSFNGISSWMSPPYFYPDPNVRPYTDLLLGASALYIPLRSLGVSMFPAVSFLLFLLTLVSFLSCYLAIRFAFRLSMASTLIASALFAGAHIRFAQLAHLQLQYTILNPLIFAAIVALFIRTPILSRRHFFAVSTLATFGFILLAATNVYHALFLALFLLVFILALLTQADGRSKLKAVLRFRSIEMCLAFLVSLPLILLLIQQFSPLLEQSVRRPWLAVEPYLVSPKHLWWMGKDSIFWGWLGSYLTDDTIEQLSAEHRIGFGLFTSVFAIGTVASLFRRQNKLAGQSIAIALAVCLVLPVKFPGDFTLWHFVHSYLPGADGVRAISRFYLVLLLPLAVIVGFFFERLKSSPRFSRWAPLFASLVLLEQVGVAEVYNPVKLQLAESVITSRFYKLNRPESAENSVCKAFIVVPSKDHRFYQGKGLDFYSSRAFPREQYLAHNPDVASGWEGDPFEHYQLYGKEEVRMISDGHASLVNDYQSYNLLASLWLQTPTVAGHSGYWHPQWKLRDVFSPMLKTLIAEWGNYWWGEDWNKHRICRIEFDI